MGSAIPDSKVHGANMGPMNLAIRGVNDIDQSWFLYRCVSQHYIVAVWPIQICISASWELLWPLNHKALLCTSTGLAPMTPRRKNETELSQSSSIFVHEDIIQIQMWYILGSKVCILLRIALEYAWNCHIKLWYSVCSHIVIGAITGSAM